MYLLSHPFCNIQTTTDSLVLLAEWVMKYIFPFYEKGGMKDISRIDWGIKDLDWHQGGTGFES
jgi:hypothetical protein